MAKLSRTRARSSVTPATSASGGSSFSTKTSKRMIISDKTAEDLPLTSKDIPAIVKAVVDAISRQNTRNETSDYFTAGLDT